MFKIETITPEKATGSIEKAYSIFPKELGVPAPLQMFSANPELLDAQVGTLRAFMQQDEIPFPLLTAIRYMVASHFNYDYCINLNKQLLLAQGVEEQELTLITEDPANAFFEPNENALLAFVARAVKAPGTATQEDVDQLRAMGWKDGDIFAATAHGANMISAGVLFKTFAS